MHEAEVAAGGFVVARGKTAKLLASTHQPLNPVALPIAVQVHGPGYPAAGLAGNDGLGSEGLDGSQYLIGILRFVGQHLAGFANGLQQFGLLIVAGE